MLDTNIVIDLLRGNLQIKSVVSRTPVVYIPVNVLGELYVGAFRAVNKQKKTKEINTFLLTCTVLNLQAATAEMYANVRAKLLWKGRPIPDNDIWIAAAALQHNLPLYTNDAHFREVDGLQLFNPLTSA